jgi:DNA-binding CsgD family transcriptional regulator
MGRADNQIGVVERAYDVSGSDEAWLDGVHAQLRAMVGNDFGLRAGTWAMHDNEFSDLSAARGDLDGPLGDIVTELVLQIPPELRAKVYGPSSGNFIGDADTAMPGVLPAFLAACEQRGIRDVGGIFGMLIFGNPGRNGVVFVAPTRERLLMSAAERRKLQRLAVHIGAGFRLRLAIEELKLLPVAVLSPSGSLLHADASAQNPDARHVLESAVKRLENVRGSLRRTAPDEAMTLWKGLVDGRWTIVDWVDSDARRYLVAYENPVSARHPRALTPRELDVAEYLVQGRSTSEIAWTLGLSVGTVSRTSREVLRKLKVRRRSDLAAVFGTVAPFKLGLERSEFQFLTAGSNEALWSRLTGSERAVLELVFDGASVVEVARSRKVSSKTVSNQLGAVYARFGVRGRSELASLLGVPRT